MEKDLLQVEQQHLRSGDMQRIVERPESEEAMSISVSRNYMDQSSQNRGADESNYSQNNNSATEVRQSRTIS